jgi:hypothetical protein
MLLDLPILDNILLKTDFLVQYNEIIPHLGLLKILLFQYISCGFESELFLDSRGTDCNKNPNIDQIIFALCEHKTKLHAAYARERIEAKAAGSTNEERLANLVDWSALQQIEDIPVSFRLRCDPGYFLLTVTNPKEEFAWPSDSVQIDPNFPELIRVPQCYATDLLESELHLTRKVVLQDMASLLPMMLLREVVLPQFYPSAPGDRVMLDVRSHSGTTQLFYALIFPWRWIHC